jgi:hypothetical protein
MLQRKSTLRTGVVRDVADFHLRWAEFRPLAESAQARKSLPARERDTINWLIRLADRVGQHDLC